jgi:hypothetical protein
MKKLSRHELIVLKMIIGGQGAIDAADFADEIATLLQAGLVELSGTLLHPQIAATEAGRKEVLARVRQP